MNPKDFIGVVLCGGKSTRMGRDKGLISKGDCVWAEVVRKKIDAFGIQSVISINSSQKEPYSKHFNFEELIVDCIPNCSGPMNGLLSIHNKYPEKHILLIATDMLDVDQAVLDRLFEEFYWNKAQKSVTWESQGFVQPMCSIYSKKNLSDVCFQASNKTPGLTMFFYKYQSSILKASIEVSLKLNNYNKI